MIAATIRRQRVRLGRDNGMARFEATTSDEAGRVRVALVGECDLAVREQLTAALLAAVHRAPVVVVDVGGLDFLDSSGVHGLVVAHRAAKESGTTLFLVNPSGSVATVLDLTGVGALLSPPPDSGRVTG
jgi:anti-sigma B factor antagonist